MKKKKYFVLLLSILLMTGCGENGEETETSLYCEEGILYKEQCVTAETMDATISCEDGYTLNSEEMTCTKTETVNATSKSTCSSGYTLSGSKCVSNTSYDKTTTSSCLTSPSSIEAYLKSAGKITNYTYDNYTVGFLSSSYTIEKVDVDCESGDTMVYSSEESNGKCIYYRTCYGAGGEFHAANGWTFSKSTTTYCPSGTTEISGKCKKTATPTTTYSCSDGYTLSGSKCTKTETVDAIISCEDDEYTYNEESGLCVKLIYSEPKTKEVEVTDEETTSDEDVIVEPEEVEVGESTDTTSDSSSESTTTDDSSSSSGSSTSTGSLNSTLATEFQDAINEYRTSLGLKKLTYTSSLQDYANTRAKELATLFSHTRPNGTYCIESGNIKSEIIGQSSSAKTTLVMTGWKNSTSHNEIMTSTKYTKFAAASYTENGRTYTVVLFA